MDATEPQPPWVVTEQGSTVIDRNEVVRTIALEVMAHTKDMSIGDVYTAKDMVLYSYFRDVETYIERLKNG